jgi:adenylate kinase family enzyme
MTHIATAHLVYGPTAAGKSTYARTLAANKNAVRFAIDEWMHALFSQDMPEKLDMAWIAPRVARCHALIWTTRKQHTRQRDAHKSDTYSFDVTPTMFDFMETLFERPSAAELAYSNTISTGAEHG